jgi:hypothetical protein
VKMFFNADLCLGILPRFCLTSEGCTTRELELLLRDLVPEELCTDAGALSFESAAFRVTFITC